MISYREAAQAIAAGRFRPAYLFCGDEPFLIRELSDQLAAAYLGEEGDYGKEKLEGSAPTLLEALQRLDEANLFAPRKLLLVDEPPYLIPKRKESLEGEKKGEEGAAGEGSGGKAVDQLEHFMERESAAENPSRIIVFQAAAVDRRRRLFKLLERKGAVVDCAPLRGDDLSRWIRERPARQGIKIEAAALQRLLWSGGNDLHALSNELEKYCTYLDQEETTITAAVVELLYSGDVRGNVFTLTDALSEGKPHRALQLLDLLAGKREDPLKIFFMLVRHYRLLLIARSLRESKAPPQEHPGAMGVKPFEARKLFSQSAAFNGGSLEEIIIYLQKLDYKIKTGQVIPQQALMVAMAGIHQITARKTHIQMREGNRSDA